MSIFHGLKHIATDIGAVGRSAENFGRQHIQQALNFGKQLPGQGLALGASLLQDAPTAIVNLAESAISKAAYGLSGTTAGKYVRDNRDGLIDAALLGPYGLVLGPRRSEQVFATIGERAADPMSRLYHNDAFQAVGSALNQGAGLFSTLSALPDPVGAMFGAANVATEAWYGAFLSTGTFDGSVSTDDALAPARKAAEGLAQMGVGKYLDKVSSKRNELSRKDKGHKEVSALESLKLIRSKGIKRYVANGSHNLLKNYLGQLTGLGLHFKRVAKRHDAVKRVVDLLKISNEVYDKYDKLNTTKSGHAGIDKGREDVNYIFSLASIKAKSLGPLEPAHRTHSRGKAYKTISSTDHIRSLRSRGLHRSATLGSAQDGGSLEEQASSVAAAVRSGGHLLGDRARSAIQGMLPHFGGDGTRPLMSSSLSSSNTSRPMTVRDGGMTGPFYPDHWTGKQYKTAERALDDSANVAVYVNGVQTPLGRHTLAAQELAQQIGKPVVGIYNAAGSVLQDLGQSATDKFGILGMGKRNAAINTLARVIGQHGSPAAKNGGLDLYAHSQGGIIVSEAIRQAKGAGHDVRGLDVTTFGGAAWSRPEGLRGYHNYAYDSDVVPTMGGSTSVIGSLLRTPFNRSNPLNPFMGGQGMTSTADDTFTLHHRGAGGRPHGVIPDPLLDASGRPVLDKKGRPVLDSEDSYIKSLPKFRAKEAAVRARLNSLGPVGGPLASEALNSAMVTRSLGATGFAFAKSIGAGVAGLAERGYGAASGMVRRGYSGAADLVQTGYGGTSQRIQQGYAGAKKSAAGAYSEGAGGVAAGYGRLDGWMRHLPSLPGMRPNTVWGALDRTFRGGGVGLDHGLRGGGTVLDHGLRGLGRTTDTRLRGSAAAYDAAARSGGGLLDRGLRRMGTGVSKAGQRGAEAIDGYYDTTNALQRSGHGDHPDVNPAALRADLRKQSSGFLPDGNIRARLGGHLGFDPGGARLHTGPAAASASRRLNAEAFTIGNDVFFGEGRFDPHTPKGLGLIAHELTHVGQQTGTTGSKARFFTQEGGDEMEREAQHTAENVLANAGSRSGLFVEDYVREYEGEGGLTQADKQRLDRISVIALREAERMLESHGLHGHINADALDVQVEIDLSEMRDGEAARVWAEAIVREARNGIATPDLSQALKAVTKPTIARQEAESAVTTPAPLTLIVVGSPSPDQGFDLEFVNAAKAQPKNDSTLWLVEKTGYDQKKVDLAKIEEAAKGTAGVAWLTPEHGLPEVINELPDGLIEKMTVFSHGVRGLVALRYGWKDLPDYGLSLDDVKKLKGSKFTETADIEFDSCNSGVKGIGDKASIGQAVANQTGIPVTAWTGRTSYGSINRGGADVEPSTFTGPWRGDFWKELYSRTLSGSSPKKQNFYPQSDANTSSTTSSTPDVPLPMQTDQSGLRRSTLNSTRTDAGPQEQAAQAMEDAIYGHYQATANAMQPTSASQLMIQRNALTCQADSASSAATNPERTSRLDSLQDSISALSQESLQFRAVLDAMPPASSPHRAEVEASLEDHRQSLVTLLEQRIPLLSEEIASLNAQIGPNPTSSSAHPELDALGQALSQRTAELNRNQQQLNPLKRWQMRREMGTIQDQLADIDRELSTISPLSPGANTCDPSNPGSELLVQRRAELARRKREIASALTSTAVRYKQGDPQWGSQNYKQGTQDCPVKDNPPTVAYTGCGPTSLAISLNYLAQEDPERAIPSDVSIVQGAIDHAEGHGRICGRGTAGTAMVSNVQSSWADLRGRTLTLDTAQEELNNGNVVIFLCKDCSGKDAGGTSHSYGGHYMVLNGVNDAGSIFNVLDPAGHNIVTISRAELRNHTGGFWSVTRTDDTVQRQEAPGTPADKGPKEQAADSTGAAVTQAAVIADDPTIDALDLGPKAKAAAKILKQKHPEITLTSGRRSVVEQAHAMASNIVQSKNRNWIKDTYVSASPLQKWVDDNPTAKTVDEIAAGLVATMGAMSEAEMGKVSKHLSGEAFDVQPQAKDADAIKKDMEALPDKSKFLDHEGGLERWHVQFKKKRGPGRHSKGESVAARNERSASQAEAAKAQTRLYDPTPKHGRLFGSGTPMDLDDATAQKILDQGVQGNGKQIYGYWNEKVYVFQPDAAGGYHGYPANSPRNVRNEALKLMLERGLFSANVYHKLRKEVGYG